MHRARRGDETRRAGTTMGWDTGGIEGLPCDLIANAQTECYVVRTDGGREHREKPIREYKERLRPCVDC